MNSIVVWLWDGPRGFKPEHVNTLQRMIHRHMTGEPYNFICVTDEPKEKFNALVNVLPLPLAAKRLSTLRTPEGPRFPSCYQRLWMFSEEARVLGSRVLLLDVDVVVAGDLSPLFDLPGDFVGWYPYRDWGVRRKRFGGGIYVITSGSRVSVYERFAANPQGCIGLARRAKYKGSDQAWISYCLAEKEPHMDHAAGVYSVRDPGIDRNHRPATARIIQMNGKDKPWNSDWPWVKAAWSV